MLIEMGIGMVMGALVAWNVIDQPEFVKNLWDMAAAGVKKLFGMAKDKVNESSARVDENMKNDGPAKE